MYYIYELRHDTKPLSYIGYTKDLKERYNNHKKRSKRKDCNNKLNRAFKQLGFETFSMIEIDRARTIEKAKEKEKYYIQKVRALLNSHHAYYDESVEEF